MQTSPSSVAVVMTFLIALLGGALLLALWAQLFAGAWHRVDFAGEVPNALIFASVVTPFVAALLNMPAGRARNLIVFGFMAISLQMFFEMLFKKYIISFPETGPAIIPWFAFFGLTNFIGIVAVLAGFKKLLKTRHE